MHTTTAVYPLRCPTHRFGFHTTILPRRFVSRTSVVLRSNAHARTQHTCAWTEARTHDQHPKRTGAAAAAAAFVPIIIIIASRVNRPTHAVPWTMVRDGNWRRRRLGVVVLVIAACLLLMVQDTQQAVSTTALSPYRPRTRSGGGSGSVLGLMTGSGLLWSGVSRVRTAVPPIPFRKARADLRRTYINKINVWTASKGLLRRIVPENGRCMTREHTSGQRSPRHGVVIFPTVRFEQFLKQRFIFLRPSVDTTLPPSSREGPNSAVGCVQGETQELAPYILPLTTATNRL